MKNQRILLPYLYALITIVCTFLVGQLILWFVPDNTNIWASVLFIFMNLLPMLVAFGFVQMSGEMSGIGQILKAAFSPHERRYAYVTALAVPLIYYGISVLLGNVTFTGSPFSAMIAYFPWTLLQGGLEEVGWRWYLQTHISIKKSFVLKMLVISVIWFIWHFPIYRLPWITAGSSNYLIFFLMILGCSKRIVARLHSLHSRPHAYRHSGGHHACWEQFNKSSFACRRGNYPLCDSGRHIGPQAKAAKPGLNPLSAK